MKFFFRALMLFISSFALFSQTLSAAERFNVAWSHYTGWEPWGYAEHAGIVKKWADKYGIDIKLTLVNDYIESINLYTIGKFDACTMTNMDALTIPATGGIDSTALIVGDFSNGNDGIVMKNGDSIKALKGRDIKLVALSVSHYLLARALDKHGMTERDVRLVNTSDADIAAVFIADANGVAVTWNPPLQSIKKFQGATEIFNSSDIPGEIIDLMVVKSNASDKLKKALVGAWYETMAILQGDSSQRAQAIAYMAKASGTTVAEFEAQLKTTAMFYQADKAATFTLDAKIKATMERVRTFSFDKGLYGEGAPSKDLVGIAFPDGTIMGDAGNVKFRFDARYMWMAADNKL